MEKERWYTAEDGAYAIRLPEGWEAEREEGGDGVDLYAAEGVGELHLLGFEASADEPPDPGEELFAFLDENEVVLEEDEVEDVSLADGGDLAFCEYVSEDEESGESDFWLIGVAALPGALVFAHYICPAGEEHLEREAVLEALRTIRLPTG
jgi:hypothetical protein